jgi:hypothetical protein
MTQQGGDQQGYTQYESDSGTSGPWGIDRTVWILIVVGVLLTVGIASLVLPLAMRFGRHFRAVQASVSADKQELVVENVSVTWSGSAFMPKALITGTIRNTGSITWKDIVMKIEMFAGDRYVGDVTTHLNFSLGPGQAQSFSVSEPVFFDFPVERITRKEPRIDMAFPTW